jgi:hypothetical protein
VEGLPAGLVLVLQAALEALADAGLPSRPSYASLVDAGASRARQHPQQQQQQQPQQHSQQQQQQQQRQQADEAGEAADEEEDDEDEEAELELQRYALLWSLAALAALCRSPPVAARVAALAGLPAALTAALRFRELRIHLYAAGGRRGRGPTPCSRTWRRAWRRAAAVRGCALPACRAAS